VRRKKNRQTSHQARTDTTPPPTLAVTDRHAPLHHTRTYMLNHLHGPELNVQQKSYNNNGNTYTMAPAAKARA
jgi:hypothetical protein